MTLRNCTYDLGENSPVSDALVKLHEQNLTALSEAVKLALDGAQSSVDRYNEIVSETHRRFAVLRWRGTPPLDGHPIINDIRHWQHRAQEARALVQDVTGAEARARLLKIAAEYERIAERARERVVAAESNRLDASVAKERQ
jgi:hypothetical protein